MRSFVSVALFILAGLAAAFVTGFHADLVPGHKAYDEEQEGLEQRIVIKFNHVVAENTPKGLAAERFAELVRKKTDGRVEVQVYPNGILYSDRDEFDALMRGEIQMIAPAFSNLSTRIPAWLVLDLPFAFDSEEELQQALGGEIGRILLQTLEERGMRGLTFWSNGFKQMSSSKRPLLEPGDFAGHRFRILPSPVLEAQFQALGASAESIPFNEVYRNLENGKVDGQENTISNIYTKRLYQVQRHLTLSNHGYLGYVVIVNKPFWDSLPEDIRAKIEEALEETTAWANRQAVAMNREQLALLRQTGIRIHTLTPDQKQRWQERFRPVYERYAPVIGYGLVDKLERLKERRP